MLLQYRQIYSYNSDIYWMKTKEAQNTKQTLNANKDNFKKLQAAADNLRDDVHKKVLRQIKALEKQQEQYQKRDRAKRKALALKEAYQDDDNSPEEVPIDGQVRAGTMVFMKNCANCHSMEAVDMKPMKGPSLGLIYNKRAGSNTNYEFYSKKLLQSTFFWSAKNLYKFMGNPSSLVPKTTCGLGKYPLGSEQDRADLITMFREFTGEMVLNVRMKQIQKAGYTAYQTQLHVQSVQLQRGNLRDKREQKIQKPF